MSIYAYLCCKNCSTALWLGKWLQGRGFWRAGWEDQALESLVTGFMDQHARHSLTIVDEGELPEAINEAPTPASDGGPSARVASRRWKCSCGELLALERGGALALLERHMGHVLTVSE